MWEEVTVDGADWRVDVLILTYEFEKREHVLVLILNVAFLVIHFPLAK